MDRELVKSWTRKDFHIEWFSGTGPGGQYRNKHQNCCRIKHIESGLIAQSTEHRDRPSNQRDAFRRLAQLVVDHYTTKEQRERYAAPKETIRTYHQPDNRVKDHLSGFQQTYDEVIISEDLSQQIEARRSAMVEQLLKDLTEEE